MQLAAALVHDPVLLVLDEPFAGLDPLGVEALSAVIAELARNGAAVMFSSHQLDLVEHVCQDVVVHRPRARGAGRRARAAARSLQPALLRSGSAATHLDAGVRTRPRARGRARPPRACEVSDGVDLRGAGRSSRAAAGDLTRFSLEPPALSDLFHEAVGDDAEAPIDLARRWREITERTQGRAFMISTIAIVAVVLAARHRARAE